MKSPCYIRFCIPLIACLLNVSLVSAEMDIRLDPHHKLGRLYQKTDADDKAAEDQAGADLVLNVGSWLTLSGLSSHHRDSEDWREHRYNAQLTIHHLVIEPSFEYFAYKDYFSKGSERNSIFHFLRDSEEILAISGTDVIWQGLGPVEVGVRGRQYDYDIRNERATYMAGLLTVNTTRGNQIGVEVGRMEGETSTNIYNLYRGFFYWQKPFRMESRGFISGDALYIAYEAPVYGEDKSIQYTLSAGRQFFNNKMETKLSGIFSQDPYFKNDIGGVMTLQIHY